MSHPTLLIDDDRAFTAMAASALAQAGFLVTSAPSLFGARQALAAKDFDLVLLDRRLPDGDGLQFLKELLHINPNLSVVMVTADDDITSAVEALRVGAKDYVVKPVALEDLIFKAKRAFNERQLRDRLAQAERELSDRHRLTPPVSKVMQEVLGDLSRIAQRPFAPVLLLGETGVGKEVLARHLHQQSAPSGPFVHVNCANIHELSAESELFGHEKGAFTDAKSSRRGLVELAEGGTLFLDEVGELSTALQAKLLTFLDSGEFRRMGASDTRRSRTRIVAATLRPLEKDIETGKFRTDLWFRLSVFKIHIPPLRARVEDVYVLAAAFLEKLGLEMGRPHLRLSGLAKQRLASYPFVGNVRELKNVLERAAVLEGSEELSLDILERSPIAAPASPQDDFVVKGATLTLEELQEKYVAHVVKKMDGRKMEAAAVLGISYPTLAKKLKDF